MGKLSHCGETLAAAPVSLNEAAAAGQFPVVGAAFLQQPPTRSLTWQQATEGTPEEPYDFAPLRNSWDGSSPSSRPWLALSGRLSQALSWQAPVLPPLNLDWGTQVFSSPAEGRSSPLNTCEG